MLLDASLNLLSRYFFYAPKLLRNKCQKLKKQTGNPKLYTEYQHPLHTLSAKLTSSVVRPFRLIGTQPVVQVLSIYMAYIYGLMYLIALGLGFFIGSQFSAQINDRIFRKLVIKARRNLNFHIPFTVPESILVPAGLSWYGWTAEVHTHWILPNVGVRLLGTIVAFQCIQTYLDAYTRYAASCHRPPESGCVWVSPLRSYNVQSARLRVG
ncbi:hypothetical protein V1515DRAFT_612053 [Lipomyces mesembrius]